MWGGIPGGEDVRLGRAGEDMVGGSWGSGEPAGRLARGAGGAGRPVQEVRGKAARGRRIRSGPSALWAQMQERAGHVSKLGVRMVGTGGKRSEMGSG